MKAPDKIGLTGLPRYFDDLFAACDNLIALDRVSTRRADVGGAAFTFHASSDARLEFILSRLAARAGTVANGMPIFSLSGNELAWRVPVWNAPVLPLQDFETWLVQKGYRAHHPCFERGWIVQRLSDGMAVHIVQDWADLQPWDGGAPLRWIMHWSAQRRGHRLIHAGTLAAGDKGVLLCGPGGSGKSGTVLAGLSHGLSSVGDDYVLLSETGAPRVQRVYDVMKQDETGLARLPQLAERFAIACKNWQGKYEFNPRASFPGRMADSFDIKAILLPHVAHKTRCEFHRLGKIDAIRKLAKSMSQEFSTESLTTLISVNRLVARAPTYELSLGRDPAEIASAIRAFILETSA